MKAGYPSQRQHSKVHRESARAHISGSSARFLSEPRPVRIRVEPRIPEKGAYYFVHEHRPIVSLRRRGRASDFLPMPRRRKDTVHRAAALHKCFIKLESFVRLLLLVS
jgi:hypothetical protein